ncbi:Transcription factor [Zea mays]|uniref:Transcription factor n=1 Tax=Zea mays TaxID=4577 RepID=A0A1D6I5C4_MAIZE|nr:Transcription factor [Zea mays]
MASSPSLRPTDRLRRPPASPAFCSFSAVSLRGLVSLSSASRVLSVSFRQRLLTAVRSSRDPGEVIDVASGEGTELPGGSTGPRKDGKETAKSFSTKELLEKLKRYGVAGVLSYGLLNTVYYVTAFLLVWLLNSPKQLFRFYVAPAPGRMGYGAAVERFVKLMAMVWAGSQVTKIFRAGG